jgi:hypothetical protein
MKSLLFVTLFFSLFNLSAQTIPSANVKKLSGETVNTSTFENDGNLWLLVFGLHGASLV